MIGLRAYQEEMKKLVFFQDTEATESALWKDGLPDRLRVYRANARGNWSDTLDQNFALTRRQFDPAAWQALRRRYFMRHPPRHWELNTVVASFPLFLETQKVPPYVKELADFEWHDLRIFIDRAVVRPDLGVTNPTAVVRVYRHQIFRWAEAEAPAQQPPEATPEVLVFYRDTKNTLHIQEADPLMLLLLEHFRIPGATVADVEPLRTTLLPTNHVSLRAAVHRLTAAGLLLL